jgi:hypothetical protein
MDLFQDHVQLRALALAVTFAFTARQLVRCQGKRSWGWDVDEKAEDRVQ